MIDPEKKKLYCLPTSFFFAYYTFHIMFGFTCLYGYM